MRIPDNCPKRRTNPPSNKDYFICDEITNQAGFIVSANPVICQACCLYDEFDNDVTKEYTRLALLNRVACGNDKSVYHYETLSADEAIKKAKMFGAADSELVFALNQAVVNKTLTPKEAANLVTANEVSIRGNKE